MNPTDKLQLDFGSDIPTARAPDDAAITARALAPTLVEQDVWCDSEAPTGVAVERPLLPRPPRSPTL